MVLLSENHDMVYSHSKKYAREFKDSFNQQFSIGEKVYIRNDHKNNKMDKEFDTFGTVIDILGFNRYMIEDDSKIKYLKHPVQLKKWQEDVGDPSCYDVDQLLNM
ncbi:hypothetical protein M153_32390001506 [Pseudoloma neurophilia]|uniref:Transposable element n=1 Tax=Pseudoloma neurophilia TaxID=146866 RepID=A0A0R0M055_9MICR|nr:hypothetical protein M153_32390001506 [Pseudoloma neurophilia]